MSNLHNRTYAHVSPLESIRPGYNIIQTYVYYYGIYHLYHCYKDYIDYRYYYYY